MAVTPERSRRWIEQSRADLAEARAASDARTLSERADEAVALYLLTVQEIARKASDRDALAAKLAERIDPPYSPAARWRALRGRRA